MKPLMHIRAFFAVTFFLYSVYLCSFSGKIHVMDELALFAMGDNLAQTGQININQLIWTHRWTHTPPGVWGQDGNLYSKKPPGMSLLVAPLLWLGHRLPGINAIYLGLLTNLVVTALTGGVVMIWLQDMGFSKRASLCTSLGYGLCTLAWIYARMFWGLSVLALLYTLLFWTIYRFERATSPKAQWGWLGVISLNLALSPVFRFEAVLGIGLILFYLGRGHVQHLYKLWVREKIGLKIVLPLIAGLPLWCIGIGLIIFNTWRFGSFTETGYTAELRFQAPWLGLYGLLISPGQGILAYTPFLGLALPGLFLSKGWLPSAYRWLLLGFGGSYLFFYSIWTGWGGIWNWGPRLLIPFIPLTIPFIATLVAWLEKYWRPGQFAGYGKSWGLTDNFNPPQQILAQVIGPLIILVLVVSSLCFNIGGLVVNFNHFFSTLSSDTTFISDWATFPPLANWWLLIQGQPPDFIWFNRTETSFKLDKGLLYPLLLLVGLGSINLRGYWKTEDKDEPQTRWFNGLVLTGLVVVSISVSWHVISQGSLNHLERADMQANRSLTAWLAANTQTGDALVIALPPFGDAHELTSWLLAHQDSPLPTYMWFETGPRQLMPYGREKIWRTLKTEHKRVWLLERWIAPIDPMAQTQRDLNREAFLQEVVWLKDVGRLQLYNLAEELVIAQDLHASFEGGIELTRFELFTSTPEQNQTLHLRLKWYIPVQWSPEEHSPEVVTLFIHLLPADNPATLIAQHDRLLIDSQQFAQSPLHIGESRFQGYTLVLPPDLQPGAYTLVVGLYGTHTQQRLIHQESNGDDFIYLTTVTLPLKTTQ